MPGRRAFGVRQLLSWCCVDTDRAAAPMRNTIAATVSLSAKTAAPSPFSLLRLVVADENTAVPSESRRTDDPEVANSSPTTGSIATLTVWPQSGLLGASQ